MKTKFKFSTIKKFASLIVMAIMYVIVSQYGYSQVAINTDSSLPDAPAILDVKAVGLGLLLLRTTEEERNAIASPATGLPIYQTDETAFLAFKET